MAATLLCAWLPCVVMAQQVAPSAAEVPADAETPAFQLNELRVLHNTVLTPLAISKLLYPYLGDNKTLKDVDAARAALEAEYHTQGFGAVYVSIPEQTVGDDGVVRLEVTEATLQRPRVTGGRYFANRQIRAAVSAAQEGATPNLNTLQAQITAVNAVTSDRLVTPVLKAGTEPSTVALEMKVDDTLPLHGSLELNNQYTADTKPLRVLAALRWDNAFDRQDSFALQYQTAPEDTSQVRVFVGSYLLRLPQANKLALTYVDSKSNVATVGDINVAGKGKTSSITLNHAIETSTSVISSVQLGLSYKDSLQDVLLGGESALSTPLRYTTMQAGYNWMLQVEPRVWTWNNMVTLGIPGLGDSQEEFANKCFGCRSGFVVWHTDASIAQKLPHDWQTSFAIAGQYTPDSVVSNEQWLIGGAHSVRGYLESEELGDIGLRASVELRTPNLLPEKTHSQLTPYLFYDWGRSRFNNPLPDVPATVSLSSVGAGVDFSLWTHASGTLVYGRALKDASHTQKGDGRVQFAVRGTW